MEFEWDKGKDAVNRAKHGLALADAARLDWVRGRTVPDLRADYGEARFVLFARMDGRLHVCIFAKRGERTRIISLRKANSREIRDNDH